MTEALPSVFPAKKRIAKTGGVCLDDGLRPPMKSLPPETPPAGSGHGLLERIALVCAACLVVVRRQLYRRNLIFGLTLLALGMAFAGAIPRGESLLARPFLFTFYWVACFLLVGLILGLACYDLRQVYRDQKPCDDFSDDLAEAEKEARTLAETELASMRAENGSQKSNRRNPPF